VSKQPSIRETRPLQLQEGRNDPCTGYARRALERVVAVMAGYPRVIRGHATLS